MLSTFPFPFGNLIGFVSFFFIGVFGFGFVSFFFIGVFGFGLGSSSKPSKKEYKSVSLFVSTSFLVSVF